MGFRKRESDLEQRLRAERPQPRDEFVHSLSKLVEPVRKARRAALPKLAFVGVFTVGLAASLGATGALGSAGGSMQSFGFGIVHLIAPAKASPPRLVSSPPKISSGATAKPATVTLTTTTTQQNPPGQTDGNGNTNYGNATPTHFPAFNHQYGFKIPICWLGHIIYVSPFQLFWYFTHGGRAALQCKTGIPINP